MPSSWPRPPARPRSMKSRRWRRGRPSHDRDHLSLKGFRQPRTATRCWSSSPRAPRRSPFSLGAAPTATSRPRLRSGRAARSPGPMSVRRGVQQGNGPEELPISRRGAALSISQLGPGAQVGLHGVSHHLHRGDLGPLDQGLGQGRVGCSGSSMRNSARARAAFRVVAGKVRWLRLRNDHLGDQAVVGREMAGGAAEAAAIDAHTRAGWGVRRGRACRLRCPAGPRRIHASSSLRLATQLALPAAGSGEPAHSGRKVL